MRPKGSADRLAYRRQWAAQLLDEGRGVNEVARLVRASPSSVSRWKAMKAHAGEEGLKAKPHPGRGCRLSGPDKEQLKQLLLAGPQAAGFDTALWTCRRVAQVIAHTFGVSTWVVCCMGWVFRASIPSTKHGSAMRRPSANGA